MTKNILLIIALAGLGAFGQATSQTETTKRPQIGDATALVAPQFGVWTEPVNRPRHQVVMLHAQTSWRPQWSGTNYVYSYQPPQVYYSSSSQGAPAFPQFSEWDNWQVGETVGLADAIAQLLDEGFRIVHASDDNLSVLMVR